MDSDSAVRDYLPVPEKKYPAGPTLLSVGADQAEKKYWAKFKRPVVMKEYASVTHVEFAPTRPHDFAVTSSTRVQIYSCSTHTVKKTLSRFKDVAYSGSFRPDGKMMVAGDAQGTVQIFDLASRAMLRSFNGHKDTVRVTGFSSNLTQVMSASDDRTVRIWDIPSETALFVLDEHQDHVRTASISRDNPNIILSGSYDHTLKLWDTRSPTPCIHTMNHGFPIESALFLPGSSMIASAGGNKLKLWNVLTGGTHFQTLHNHQKNITALCLDGSGRRLLSGGLDNMVKVYDVEDWNVCHSFKYPAAVLSMAVSPDDTHLVVGMSSGLLSIRQRVVKTEEVVGVMQRRAKIKGGTLRHFRRGTSHKGDVGDIVVERKKVKRMQKWDELLRKFHHGKALDVVLGGGNGERPAAPVMVVSVLEELIHRGQLVIALGARDDVGLEPITKFILQFISNPKYTTTLVHVAEVIMDMYAPVIGQSVLIDELFIKLRFHIERELSLQEELVKTLGLLESLMLASQRMV
ncbi:snoRNA-binding rRNA-processing protein [Rhizoclosmatium sp. JEL0117]|nr:snoRNA-binding rRNA-processing protein [Rhizoclosmatium sp. JEL0117]